MALVQKIRKHGLQQQVNANIRTVPALSIIMVLKQGSKQKVCKKTCPCLPQKHDS